MSKKTKAVKKSDDTETIEPEFEWVPEKAERVPDEQRHRIKADDKVKITMYVDWEVLKFFKDRAKLPDAAPYQTQMNNVLRQFMEKDDSQASFDYLQLVNDKHFIEAIAQQVEKRLVK